MGDRLKPIEYETLYKSNTFISAKYKSTLLENQITSLALTRIQQKLKDESTELIAEIYPGELKKIFESSNNIYRTLKNISSSLSGRTILIEDNNGNFVTFPIIQKASYIDGVFTVRFNEEVRPLISNLTRDYTPLEISVLTSVKSNYTFRLYELFEREMYEKNRKFVKELNCVVLEYGLSELKFTIGICNIDDENIKNERARMGKNIDYDVLYNKLPKSLQKYNESYDFMRRVILPAQKELEEKSNIRFDYEAIKTKGNKVGRIRFFLFANNENEIRLRYRTKLIADAKQNFKKTKEQNNRQLEMAMDLNMELYDEFVGFHGLTKQDIDVLMQKADYDAEKVREAIHYTNERTHIDIGFMNYVVSVLAHPEWDLGNGAVVINGSDVNPELIKIARNIGRDMTVEENKKKNSKQIWESVIKPREDFSEFKSYIENKYRWGIDDFEAIFDYEEMIGYWKEWHKERM